MKVISCCSLILSPPGGAPDSGEDPLRLHLHGLDVLHLGQGRLGQLASGADCVADLPVQELSLLGVGGQVVQQERGRGSWTVKIIQLQLPDDFPHLLYLSQL